MTTTPKGLANMVGMSIINVPSFTMSNCETLVQPLIDADFISKEQHPSVMSAGAALERAVNHAVGGSASVTKTRTSGVGFVVSGLAVSGQAAGERHDLDHRWTVVLDRASNEPVFDGAVRQSIADAIVKDFTIQRESAGIGETRTAVEAVIKTAGGVRMATRIWAVSPNTLRQLDTWSQVVGSPSYRIVVPPGQPTADNLAWVMENFVPAFIKDAKDLADDMVTNRRKNKRWWTGYDKKLDKLTGQVEELESMLGSSQNDLRDVLVLLKDESTAVSVSSTLAALL